MKKVFLLSMCIVFILSLAACSTAKKVVDDAESMGEDIVSDTESIADDAKDKMKDNDSSMNLMAGITASQALESALKHAGLSKSQVSDIDIDLDRDNDMLIYEVDFNFGNVEYDYDVNAETGEIISHTKNKD